jgi:hypothetical protein
MQWPRRPQATPLVQPFDLVTYRHLSLHTVPMVGLSGASLFWYIVGFIALAVGARWAIMKRANRDYKATKAAVKGLRKNFWASLRSFVSAVVLLIAILVGLVAWVVSEMGGTSSPSVFSPPNVATSTAPAKAPAQQVRRQEKIICFSAECRRQHPE